MKALPHEKPHVPIGVPSGGYGVMVFAWQATFLHLPSLVMPPSTCGEQPLHVQPAGHLQTTGDLEQLTFKKQLPRRPVFLPSTLVSQSTFTPPLLQMDKKLALPTGAYCKRAALGIVARLQLSIACFLHFSSRSGKNTSFIWTQ